MASQAKVGVKGIHQIPLGSMIGPGSLPVLANTVGHEKNFFSTLVPRRGKLWLIY